MKKSIIPQNYSLSLLLLLSLYSLTAISLAAKLNIYEKFHHW